MPAVDAKTFRGALCWRIVKVGVIQSSFIPWRGYFDFIASVDLFVFYDDVQYSKNGWRNRNRIKCRDGTRWLTVPVRHRKLSQRICETEIDDRKDWRSGHHRLWNDEYANSPFFDDAMQLLGNMGAGVDVTISELNVRLIRAVCGYLDIATPMIFSGDLNIEGTGTDRLISLLREVRGTTYLSGPSADNYLDKSKFREAGVRLEYKSYDYGLYPQLWGAFDGAVTVLDVIANLGPNAKGFIRSLSPDKVVVE